ncbi:unnamed protein product [Rhodiola kirilowii]
MVCRRNKWFGHKCKGEKLLQKLCSRHQRPRLTRLDLRKLIWCKTQSVIWPCLSLNLMDRGWETGARSLDDVEITVESSQNAGVESDPILNDEVEAQEVEGNAIDPVSTMVLYNSNAHKSTTPNVESVPKEQDIEVEGSSKQLVTNDDDDPKKVTEKHNMKMQSTDFQISEKFTQKISSYGDELFYCTTYG